MSFVPYAFREKAKCKQCGTQSYVTAITTEDGVFCSLECATTYKWRLRFKYYDQRKSHA